MGSDRIGAVRTTRRQPWLWVLGCGLIVSAILLVTLRANLGFFLDDWALIFYREDSPTDWLLPHHEHIIVLPAAIYKLSLATFGMNAFPLHLVAVTLFLVSVTLLFLWLRPLVGEPSSALGCLILLFLGAGAEDLLWAFQMGFFGSAAGGLGAMLLIRRNTTAADVWACVLLIVALLFSSLAIPFVAGAATQILLRDRQPGRPSGRHHYWVFLVPAAVFAAWWLGWGHLAESGMSVHNAVADPLYALSALAYSGAVSTGLFPIHRLDSSYIWAVPGLVLLAFLALAVRRRGKLPPELLVALVAAFAFWLLTGLNLIPGRGFHTSRYQYPDVIFALMILGGAFAGLRPGRRATGWIIALVAASLAVNLFVLIYAYHHTYRDYAERDLISLTTFDLARDTVDPDFKVGVSTDDQTYVDASSYFAATGKYGSPGLSERQVERASAEHRDRLDQLLALALGARPLPARTVKRPEPQKCGPSRLTGRLPRPRSSRAGGSGSARPDRTGSGSGVSAREPPRRLRGRPPAGRPVT